MIPLAPEGAGAVRIVRGRLEIRRPEADDLEAWLARLPEEIRTLDLSGLKKAE